MKQLILNLQADTEPTGEMSQLSSPVGFRKGGENHVNHSVLPGNNLERKMTDTSGRRCLELFERSPRIGAFSKTFAALLIGQGDWYSSRCRLTWKLKGTKSSRLYFQLVPSMLPTDGIVFGLLATVTAQYYKRRGPNSQQQGLPEAAHKGLLPTPQARDEKNGSNVTDGRFQRKLEEGRTIDLNDLARSGLLPTPQATDFKGGATAESYEERGRGEKNDLRTWAAFQERTGKTSQLNPLFVAEMMGFPTDWTELPFLSGDKNR